MIMIHYILNNTGQFGGTGGIDINVLGAWNSIVGFSGECNINVAILDDGVENHEDFNGRVLEGHTIGDSTGFGAPGAGSAHGQACAGIISATHNNELGVKGVAPNTNITPVRIVGVSADLIDIAEAVDWAWDEGMADILSNSWGLGPGNCTLIGAAFDNIIDSYDRARDQGRGGLGSIVVFSSGNHGSCISFPRNINGAITVGAINNNGQIWNYSNTGSEMDLVAPSGDTDLNGNVRTTDRMGANGYESGNYTNRFGGTSAAAPQVAGVAALMLSVNPDLTEEQVRTILQQTATDMGPLGFDNTFGFGRVNAFAAVKAAVPIDGPDFVCASGAVFSIDAPVGSTVSWTSSPANLFSHSSGQGNTTPSISPASSSSRGVGTITFSVTGKCGYATFTKEVFVGTPNDALIVTASHWGPPIVREIDASTTTFAEATYNQVPVPGGHTHFIEEYEWDIWDAHSNWSIIPQHGGGPPFNADVEIDLWHNPLPAQQTIYVRVRNPCGWSLWQETFWDVVGGCSFCAFTVYPNPAAETLHIRLDHGEVKPSGSKSNLASYTIGIYSENGNLVWEKETDSTEEQIPTAAWKEGIYHVRIHHPEGNYSQKVIIRH